jgi:hypothetical protein
VFTKGKLIHTDRKQVNGGTGLEAGKEFIAKAEEGTFCSSRKVLCLKCGNSYTNLMHFHENNKSIKLIFKKYGGS